MAMEEEDTRGTLSRFFSKEFVLNVNVKNVQLLRSHLNRVKENDKEANKRRLEAMKQLNQRWQILRCNFSLQCGW